MSTPARVEIDEFKRLLPHAYEALTALGKVAREAGLEGELVELVKIRASQINGCAYCLQFHLNLARRFGLGQAKLDLLATWREVPHYSERERAALAWTEALTRLTDQDVPDAAYAQARTQFDAPQLAALSSAVALINAWNRLGVAFRWTPPPAAPAPAPSG